MKVALQKVLFLIFISLLISSCLSDTGNQAQSRIQIGLRMDSIGDTVSSAGDTLTFENIQLIHGLSFFIRDQDTLLIANQVQPFQFDANSTNPQALLSLTIFPEGTYQEFNLQIPRALEGNALIDPAFFGEEGRRFTIVLNGTFNDSTFRYRSERIFEFPFQFNPDVSVPEFNAAFTFIISTDIRGWFSTGGQGFLDPRIDNNSTAINDNIGESFRIEQIDQGDGLQ
jgi:hypothetical protein